jgi:NAD dependent epimerase/dehydratase family enzyme
MVRLGAVFLRTDPELVLKSRRVVPGRLLGAGFTFVHPHFGTAARNLVDRWRAHGHI